MIIRKMKLVVSALLLAAVAAEGGVVYLSFNQHSTQNLFQTRDAVADRISAFSLSINQDFSAVSLLADLQYSVFHEMSGLSFFAANLGLDYLKPVGAKSAFYFAAGGSGLFYRQTYTAFGALGGNLLAAFKTYLAPSSIMKLQWQGAYAAYKDPLFDFLNTTASLSIDKYFVTRTTFKADAEWGYKYFLHPFLPEPVEPLLETTLTAAGMTGMGGGGGRPYQGGYGFIPRYSSQGGGAGIGHAAVSFLAAQGFGDVVGLSVSALRQWTVSGENPFLSIEEFYLVQNPSSDAFSWDGRQFNGRLTLNLPWSVEIKAGYTYSDKTFPGVESLSLEGDPLGIVRNDLRRLVEVRFEKNFRRLTIFLAYSRVDNRSSDPLFDWKGHYIMGGFEWNLPTGPREARYEE